MIDKAIKATLFPSIEQAELIELNELEQQEHSSNNQITLKCGDAFLVTDGCGDLLSSRQEMGLFRYGTRFLRKCNLYLEGRSLVILSHQAAKWGDASHIDLTNTPFAAAKQHAVKNVQQRRLSAASEAALLGLISC